VKVIVKVEYQDRTTKEVTAGSIGLEDYADLWNRLSEVCRLDPGYLWHWRHMINTDQILKAPIHSRVPELYTTVGKAFQVFHLELEVQNAIVGFVKVDPFYMKDQRYQTLIHRIDESIQLNDILQELAPWKRD
jgi:hypothetical protein